MVLTQILAGLLALFASGDRSDQVAEPETISVRVLVLNFDPIVDQASGQRLHEEYHWNDPHTLADAYVADVKEASHGLVQYRVIGWEDLNEFPVKADGFQYTLEQFGACWKAKSGWHQPDQADYPAIITRYRLPERIEAGEFDEVWWMGFPYCGFAESAMAGHEAFVINGPVFDAPEVKCRKAFAIMGFNVERGPAEMIHNLGHRTEATMSRVFGGWESDKLDTDWARFAANAHQSNGHSACGSCHYPPNGVKDYDYANPRTVDSSADDWLGYPRLTGKTKPVNAETWGGPDYHRNYLKWWYNRLPHAPGTNPENGRLNNWWKYVFQFNDYDSAGKPRSS